MLNLYFHILDVYSDYIQPFALSQWIWLRHFSSWSAWTCNNCIAEDRLLLYAVLQLQLFLVTILEQTLNNQRCFYNSCLVIIIQLVSNYVFYFFLIMNWWIWILFVAWNIS